MKVLWAPVACAVLAVAPLSAAHASTFLVYEQDVGGAFGNTTPILTNRFGVPIAGSFSNTFTFTTTKPTLISILLGSIGSSNPAGLTYLSFSGVTLDDATSVPISVSSAFGVQTRSGQLLDFRLPAGLQKILVTGTTGRIASYVGTFALADVPAVPEASTWAMMIAGFGMVGATIRRKQHISMKVSFAA